MKAGSKKNTSGRPLRHSADETPPFLIWISNVSPLRLSVIVMLSATASLLRRTNCPAARSTPNFTGSQRFDFHAPPACGAQSSVEVHPADDGPRLEEAAGPDAEPAQLERANLLLAENGSVRPQGLEHGADVGRRAPGRRDGQGHVREKGRRGRALAEKADRLERAGVVDLGGGRGRDG